MVREYIRSRLTKAQLDAFVRANGLHMVSLSVLTPNNAPIGAALPLDQYQFGLLLAEESYYDRGGNKVSAWWPNWRTGWTIFYEDSAPQVGDMMGPGEVYCDLCSDPITSRPVPMVGDYALCPKCFGETKLPFPGTIEPYEVAED